MNPFSRIPEKLESKSLKLESGVDDRAYQVNIINSHTLSKHPVWETEEEREVIKDPHWEAIIESNQEDNKISSLRSKVEAGTTSKYDIHNGVLNYISGQEEERSLKMVIPKMLRQEILDQCQEQVGHMGIDRTYELIGKNYFWSRLYNEVVDYVTRCITYQLQKWDKWVTPVRETDI